MLDERHNAARHEPGRSDRLAGPRHLNHLNGEIAAALMAKADELLATPPEILAADVLASK